MFPTCLRFHSANKSFRSSVVERGRNLEPGVRSAMLTGCNAQRQLGMIPGSLFADLKTWVQIPPKATFLSNLVRLRTTDR